MDITTSYIFLIIILLLPNVLSRLIMEKAFNKLDGEIKLKLLDSFSNQRKYSLIISLPCLVIYLLSLKYFSEYTWSIILGFGSVYLVYIVWKSSVNYKKINQIAVSSQYIRAFRVSTFITFFGLIILGIYLTIFFNASGKVIDKKYEASVIAYKAYEKSLKRDYFGAVRDYSQAIDLDNTVANYYLNRGTTYFYLGDKVNAAKDYKKAAELGEEIANDYLLYAK